MKLALALIALIAACEKEPPPLCDAYVEKEITCSPQLAKSAHEKVRSSSMMECGRAFDGIETQNEVQAAYFKRLQHDASCAKSSATCEAYEQCRDGFDVTASIRETTR